MNTVKKLLKIREVTAFLFLAALFLVVGVINPNFFAKIPTCFNDSIVFVVLAVGMAFAIFIGEIDVSVGSNMGLVAALVGTMIQKDSSPASWAKAIAIALLIGLAVGLFNGWGVSVMKIPSLIFTLGTNGVLRGLMFPVVGKKQVTELPVPFKALASNSVLGPFTILFCGVVVLVAVVHLVLTKTKGGRYFIAVGDNAGGADLVGIPATRTKILAYVICGVMASVAGILFCSKAGQVTVLAGNGYEMQAVAACVLGGISLSGGVGSVLGAAIGAVIMSSIDYLLVFMKTDTDYNKAITGVIILTIVVTDALMQYRGAIRARHLRLAARTAGKEGAQ